MQHTGGSAGGGPPQGVGIPLALPFPLNMFETTEQLGELHHRLGLSEGFEFGHAQIYWLHVLAGGVFMPLTTTTRCHLTPQNWNIEEESKDGNITAIANGDIIISPAAYSFMCQQISICKTMAWKTARGKLYLTRWNVSPDGAHLCLWNQSVKVAVHSEDQSRFGLQVMQFLIAKSVNKAIAESIPSLAAAAVKVVHAQTLPMNTDAIGALLQHHEGTEFLAQLTRLLNVTDPNSSTAGFAASLLSALISTLSLEDRWLHYLRMRSHVGDTGTLQRIAEQCKLSIPITLNDRDEYYFASGVLWRPIPISEVGVSDLIPCGKDSLGGASVAQWLRSKPTHVYVAPSKTEMLFRKKPGKGTAAYTERGTVQAQGFQFIRGEIVTQSQNVIVLAGGGAVVAPDAPAGAKRKAHFEV